MALSPSHFVKLAIILAVLLLTPLLPAGDVDYLNAQAQGQLIDRLFAWVVEQPGFDATDAIDVVVLEGAVLVKPEVAPAELRDVVAPRLDALAEEHGKNVRWVGEYVALPPLSMTFRHSDDAANLVSIWRPRGQAPARVEMVQPFYRRFALLPPLLAIALALTFRQTLVALFAGVWVGATLVPWFQSGMTTIVSALGTGERVVEPYPGSTSFPNPLVGLWKFIADYFYQRSLQDSFRIEIIGFVAVLIAAVGVMTRGGAIAGMVDVIVRFARTVRTTRIATALMGFVIFFDDYTNAIVVGNTMRPLTDRMRISREKLAYLVDSTAAPVAGLMVLSTWVAYEVSQFAPQLLELGIEEDPYGVFIRTIPYRFYCIFTLFFVFATSILSRDFGPMLNAERRAATTGQVLRPGGQPLVASRATNMEPVEGAPRRWWNAAIPLGVVVFGTLVAIYQTGVAGMEGAVDRSSMAGWRQVLANSNTARALFIGSVGAWITAFVLLVGQRILSPREAIVASIRGAGGVVMALCILFLAWSIGEVCSDLGTAHVLIAMFRGSISPFALPIMLFLLSCAVSFSTGSSWSTMAIILPNTVLLAFAIGESYPAGPMQLTILSIGAVLEGSIFGDHCSPLSDTTILSSVASASDHIDHVRTQMPYALSTMTVALVIGYLPAVYGAPPAVSFVLGAAVLVGLLFVLGKRSDFASDVQAAEGAAE